MSVASSFSDSEEVSEGFNFLLNVWKVKDQSMMATRMSTRHRSCRQHAPRKLGEVFRSCLQDLVVEVVRRVMKRHATLLVCHAIPDEDEVAWHDLQKRAEIFRNHHRLNVSIDMRRARDARCRGHGDFDISRSIHRRRELVRIFELAFGAVRSTQSLANYQSVGLMADYNLSKRTDVYAQAAYQHVGGDKTGTVLDQAYVPGSANTSSNQSQVALRVAIRHKF
jgi:hypothetical protein